MNLLPPSIMKLRMKNEAPRLKSRLGAKASKNEEFATALNYEIKNEEFATALNYEL